MSKQTQPAPKWALYRVNVPQGKNLANAELNGSECVVVQWGELVPTVFLLSGPEAGREWQFYYSDLIPNWCRPMSHPPASRITDAPRCPDCDKPRRTGMSSEAKYPPSAFCHCERKSVTAGYPKAMSAAVVEAVRQLAIALGTDPDKAHIQPTRHYAPRLADLEPKLVGSVANGILIFDCPNGGHHRVRVPLGGQWEASGQFPDNLTVFPSIAEKNCWHGWIINGAIR